MTSLFRFDLLRSFVLVAVFLVTVAAIYAVINVISRRAAIRRNLLTFSGNDDGGGSQQTLTGPSGGAWSRVVRMVESSGLNLADSNPDALRRKLMAAGYESPDAPRIYSLIRLLMIFVFPAVLIAVFVVMGTVLTVFKLYVFGSICAVLGLIMPGWILRIMTDRRAEAITNGFPNCLDLMLVCVEAGLGMEAALDRVGREIANAEPVVAGLLVRTTLHLRAGASREEALHRLAEFARVDEIRSFCTLLIQSEKLGTSIATTLRVFAHEMRERRQMRTEEKAHRLPVLISIPLICCMLPTMVGVLMLPAAIRIIRQLVPAMGG